MSNEHHVDHAITSLQTISLIIQSLTTTFSLTATLPPINPSPQLQLNSFNVVSKLNTSVKQVLAGSIETTDSDGISTLSAVDLVILTSGTEPNALTKSLTLSKDKFGRIQTKATLQSKDYGNVFALGDCSVIEDVKVPSTAQAAMQQSDVVAKNVALWANQVSTSGGIEIETE
jgi:NADH dehydrogenase FAD-containing subunit